MSGVSRKLPLGRTLNQIAMGRAEDAIQLLGKALPCSVVSRTGTIVKVRFEVNSVFTLADVVCPLAGSEYARPPIQPGCKGVAFPADAYLGGMSGLGGGVADLTRHANLSTLVFFPIGNTGHQTVDPNVHTIYGPAGVTLRDSGGAAVFQLTATSMTLSVAGHSIVINNTGVVIDGRVFLTHDHSGVQTGGGITGPVV